MDDASISPRQSGYYWVREAGDAWTVAELTAAGWTLRSGAVVQDEQFEEIGPRIEPPAPPRMAKLSEILSGKTE